MNTTSEFEKVGISRVKMGKPCAVRFNIMVVGETGIGKTTFLKTLFKKYCTSDIIKSELCSMTTQTVSIGELGCFALESPAQDCEVHLFDSPGYGDFINNQNAIESVKKYLVHAQNAWYNMSGNILPDKGRNAADDRIHCVFYFIAPHRIKHIDKEFIKELSGLAPIVLVVAKADTMTLNERRNHLLAVKELVKELSKECGFLISYDFKEKAQDLMDDEFDAKAAPTKATPEVNRITPLDAKQAHAEFLDLSNCMDGESPDIAVAREILHRSTSPRESSVLPKIRNAFAVVCDTSDSGKREYPWGSLDIYDEEHSDFRRLQRLVFESNHISKLRDMTQVMTLQRYHNVPESETERPLKEAVHPSTAKVFLSKVVGAGQYAKWVVDKIVLTVFWVLLPPVIVAVWLSVRV